MLAGTAPPSELEADEEVDDPPPANLSSIAPKRERISLRIGKVSLMLKKTLLTHVIGNKVIWTAV